MPRLRYSAESKEYLKHIAHFIARDKPVAARQWVGKLREKCHLIANHPEMGDARPELGGNQDYGSPLHRLPLIGHFPGNRKSRRII